MVQGVNAFGSMRCASQVPCGHAVSVTLSYQMVMVG